MGSLRGHHAQDIIDAYDEFDDIHSYFERTRYSASPPKPAGAAEPSSQRLRRGQPSEAFKCLNCKAFIGMPLTGGRHRNHCPSCLWSLHVDRKTPGDRSSDCRSLMEPVGVFARRNGEQAVVHQCRGCGIERHCRLAADDNPLLLMKLPLAVPTGDAAAVDQPAEVA
ncbi:hypothetical protein BH23CHL2_BH23CHL2_05230 [soil metagenome]